MALLDLAEEAALDGRLEDADRYGRLAWKVTTRLTLTPSNELKQRVCRACKRYLLPGVRARVRTTGTKVSITCKACGTTRRIPFLDETKAKRRRPEPADDA